MKAGILEMVAVAGEDSAASPVTINLWHILGPVYIATCPFYVARG